MLLLIKEKIYIRAQHLDKKKKIHSRETLKKKNSCGSKIPPPPPPNPHNFSNGPSLKCQGLIAGVSFRRFTPSPYSLFFAISRSFCPLRERLEKERKRLLRRLQCLCKILEGQTKNIIVFLILANCLSDCLFSFEELLFSPKGVNKSAPRAVS